MSFLKNIREDQWALTPCRRPYYLDEYSQLPYYIDSNRDKIACNDLLTDPFGITLSNIPDMATQVRKSDIPYVKLPTGEERYLIHFSRELINYLDYLENKYNLKIPGARIDFHNDKFDTTSIVKHPEIDYKNGNIFIIISLATHIIIAFIDRLNKIIEIFDPDLDFNSVIRIEKLKNIGNELKKLLRDETYDIKLFGGIQNEEVVYDEIHGNCQIWLMVFAELKYKFPNVDTKELLDRFNSMTPSDIKNFIINFTIKYADIVFPQGTQIVWKPALITSEYAKESFIKEISKLCREKNYAVLKELIENHYEYFEELDVQIYDSEWNLITPEALCNK